ncbi:hypothetical protein BDB01DRAFT_715086, partial [Pilobolus umbonatus]
LESKIINSHVLKNKHPVKDKMETWGQDLGKKAFMGQGVNKSLHFEGTLETNGVGVSPLKKTTGTTRMSNPEGDFGVSKEVQKDDNAAPVH